MDHCQTRICASRARSMFVSDIHQSLTGRLIRPSGRVSVSWYTWDGPLTRSLLRHSVRFLFRNKPVWKSAPPAALGAPSPCRTWFGKMWTHDYHDLLRSHMLTYNIHSVKLKSKLFSNNSSKSENKTTKCPSLEKTIYVCYLFIQC